jgi:5'-methylthioadenosine nucleosidase
MEAEARPVIEALGLQLDLEAGDPALPHRHFTGRWGKRGETELMLTVNGRDPRHRCDSIGTDPATLSAYVTLKNFKPELCISAGTAGGWASRGAKIGDIFLSRSPLRFHDRRIPIPEFEAYGRGEYPSQDVTALADKLKFKLGNVSTGNSLNHTAEDLEMMVQFESDVKEMEAAAIARVAMLLGTPFFAVKAITDLVDSTHATQEQFLANLDLASERLSTAVIQLLRELAQITT